MERGIRAVGDYPVLCDENRYPGPDFGVAVFYGLRGRLRDAFNDYRRDGRKAVYIDLGYWGREHGGKLYGYHKFAVNARHPTAYFQNRSHPPDRANFLGIKAKPWRKDGRHILIAGMGPKAATFEGLQPEEWERQALETLRKHTERTIIYRPKPSWDAPQGLMGTVFSHRKQPLNEVLLDSFAVVTRHSNVAVDGLVEGIPAFCMEGVASVKGLQDLTKIETPAYPDGREQWVNDIAYQQWSLSEMGEGLPWRYLKDSGLVP